MRDTPRVLLVPGFTQTVESWEPVAAQLRRTHQVETLSVPRAESFAATAGALARAGGRGVWVGYSMGGRLALQLALDHPSSVVRLVLVSATAGIESAAERAARVEADEARALDIERDGVAPFLDRWLAQPLFASVPGDAPGLAQRRAVTAETLTHDLRILGTGTMAPLWSRLRDLAMPVLLATGRRDSKFDAINRRMAELIPDCEHVRLDGGHAVPLEQPAALADEIARFAST